MKFKQSKSVDISTISTGSYTQNNKSTDFIVQPNGSTNTLANKSAGSYDN